MLLNHFGLTGMTAVKAEVKGKCIPTAANNYKITSKPGGWNEMHPYCQYLPDNDKAHHRKINIFCIIWL